MNESGETRIQSDACSRCAQGVMDADRFDARGNRTAYGNDHLYGRCSCSCHAEEG